jgi:hypothetical protein
MVGLEREEEGAADTKCRSRAQAEKHSSRQTSDRRPARPKSHLLGRTTASAWLAVLTGSIRHDCGLPSMQTIRTSC